MSWKKIIGTVQQLVLSSPGAYAGQGYVVCPSTTMIRNASLAKNIRKKVCTKSHLQRLSGPAQLMCQNCLVYVFARISDAVCMFYDGVSASCDKLRV